MAAGLLDRVFLVMSAHLLPAYPDASSHLPRLDSTKPSHLAI